MMKKIYCFALFIFIAISSCRKDDPIKLNFESKVLSFIVPGEIYTTLIDNIQHTINITVPYKIDRTRLTATFTLSKDAIATINNIPQQSNITITDFFKTETMVVTAQNQSLSTWTINVLTDLEVYGLGSLITADKSLNKSYSWYYDQGVSGKYSAINCGPASVTMAIKWSDSTFTKNTEDARNTFRPNGGWWDTSDITNYLSMCGIHFSITNLPDNYQTIKNCLDKNYIVILCLDNYYIKYNANPTQHIDKFYSVNAPGSGHFIVIKGYKLVDNKFYFEAYDPWSLGSTYTLDNKLKGENRYYLSDDLEQATNVWWDWAIVVAPKGKSVTNLGIKTFSLMSVPVQKGS